MVENGFKILLVNNSDYKSEPAGSSNLCGNMVHNNVYLDSNIYAPMSGCSSVVVLSGTNVSFIASNSITLNPGFEVQLGGTFNALTQ